MKFTLGRSRNLFWNVWGWSGGITLFFALWLIGGGKLDWGLPILGGSGVLLVDLGVTIGMVERWLNPKPSRLKKWMGFLLLLKYLVLLGIVYILARYGMTHGWRMEGLAIGLGIFPTVVLLKAIGMQFWGKERVK